MKNIVFLHLESVSKLILQMNRDKFPNVSSFEKRCMNYTNYYATATSTAMVLNDITYSDFYRLENTKLFGDFIETHKNAVSFVDELSDRGYRTLGIHYPAALGNEINPGHMYAKNSDLVNYNNYEKALKDVETTIDNAIDNDENFLIYFCNEVSHLCYADNKKFHIKNPTKRWHYGYQTIDQTVGDILNILQEKCLMDNTIIVLYGDHGDDFYGHDYNGGFCHSIEPYANIIHTPLMIYDKSIGSRVIDDVICSLDIKQLIYNLAETGIKEKETYIYDIFHSKREYVFSRNLFAGQTPEKINGYISNVRKSYAITTPEYSLILTKEGWRMYIKQMDPTCNNNVLDYFYWQGGKIKHISNLDFLCVHYKSYMGHGSSGEIQRSFYKLSTILKRELKRLENETTIKEVLIHSSYSNIYYIKNMKTEFAKLKFKFIKKKTKNRLINLAWRSK